MNKQKISKFHQDSILEAADALFSANGFDKTTVDEIAKKAEYSKPTVYAYFSSKEEIFACNLYRHLETFRNKIERAVSEGENVTESYLACCFETLDFKRYYPIYYAGMMGALDYGRNGLSEIGFKIRAIGAEINATVKKLFVQAERKGLLRADIDAESAYVYIWSCVNGIVTSPLLDTERLLGESNRRAVLKEFFLNVIRAYLAH